MPSNLFGPGTGGRSSAEVKADQDRAQAVDQAQDRTRAGAAAGRDSRSIGTTRERR